MCKCICVCKPVHLYEKNWSGEWEKSESFFPLISKPYDHAGLALSTWGFQLIPWVLGEALRLIMLLGLSTKNEPSVFATCPLKLH